MPNIQAYSSVSVVDLTDVGVLNFYLTSNQPNSVVYDPNQSGGTYSPNWASSNLVITPVISYNGSTLSRTATGVTITFTRKEGSGTATALTTGESVSGGVLTVSANKMASVSSGQLTYICTLSYTDPDTGVPLSSQAQLTYTLVTMATEAKYCSIIGDNIFLYDTDRVIVGTGEITLTADLTNVSVSQWQYQQSDGTYAAFPTTNNASINGATLLVKESEAGIWINGGKAAVIKLVTDDNTVYDTHQILKVYDGAAGNSQVSCVLTNENHVVPTTSDGTVKSWVGASTELRIYEGGQECTSQWTISKTDGSGLTGTYNASTHIYTPSALTVDSSYADFTCTRTGYSTITKRYTIVKQAAGQDGQDAVIYELSPDVYAINVDESGTYTPTGVTFSAYTKSGETLSKSTYAGRFQISESTDGSAYTVKYTSGSNEATKTYQPSANTVVSIKCVLFAAGSTTTQLDEQTIVVTRDGQSGQDGTPGVDALIMGLGNYSDVIPCNTSGNASAQRDISIPFFAYKGINRVAVTATVGTLPTGVSVNSNTAGTISADGLLVLRVASGATFGSSSLMSGDITITLTAEGKTVDYKYSWTKNKQAANGTNAVLLQLYSADGGTVEEGRNTTINAIVYSGTSDVTSSSSFVWKQFVSGSYTTISGQTASSITITPAMVTDYMWLKCEATYSSKTYSAYFTIDDVTDNLTAYTFATISEFKNSQGFGAIYTRVYRNGDEVDPIKSTTFSSTAPTGASSGDYYYHLDSTAKTCTLKKYNGSSWANATSADNDTYTYSYYRINASGDSIDTTAAWKTGRCQYIDPSIVNGRMQFICEVSSS